MALLFSVFLFTERQEKAESPIVLAETLDDLCGIANNDLFGAVSTCDPLAAQLIGGQARVARKCMILMDFLTSIFPNQSSEGP